MIPTSVFPSLLDSQPFFSCMNDYEDIIVYFI